LKKTIQGKTGGWVEATSGKADNQKAFGTYQRELSMLWDETSEAEKRKMEELAVIWNRMGPPPEEQARYELVMEWRYAGCSCITGMRNRLTSMSSLSASR
jgi:hypothetical protein